MAKSTRLGGSSNKDEEVTSTVTHPKRIREEEPQLQKEAQETEEAEDDYEEWTATQLRDELADRQLSTSGRKPDLIARLRESDSELDEDEMEDETSD